MGVDFIEQLFLHPHECTPALDGDILNYLAIYAKIHEKAEIYIAVPQYGNPNRVWVWRYDRPSANLQLVGGGADGFPVRFAAVVMGGIMYNDAHIAKNADFETDALEGQATNPGDVPGIDDAVDVDLFPTYVPVNFEFRIHYNRLMVALGAEAGFNTNAEAVWVERYFLPGNLDAEVAQLRAEDSGEDNDGDGVSDARLVGDKLLYNKQTVNRNLYMGASAVLGRDAGIGFGPRLGARVGWTNVPYALQTTAHLGWAFQPPGVKGLGDRVRPFVDVDGRAGLSWPFATSLSHGADAVTVEPVFGIVAGVGSTF
jgi:hypothetical protein